MHRVGYRAVKSPVCVKKSKIAHNFFANKATDLKTNFYLWKTEIVPNLSNPKQAGEGGGVLRPI